MKTLAQPQAGLEFLLSSLPLPPSIPPFRETKEAGKLSDKCAARVYEAEEDAANDFKLDPQLNEVCSADATKLCSDVEPGEGRVQVCLVRVDARLAQFQTWKKSQLMSPSSAATCSLECGWCRFFWWEARLQANRFLSA